MTILKYFPNQPWFLLTCEYIFILRVHSVNSFSLCLLMWIDRSVFFLLRSPLCGYVSLLLKRWRLSPLSLAPSLLSHCSIKCSSQIFSNVHGFDSPRNTNKITNSSQSYEETGVKVSVCKYFPEQLNLNRNYPLSNIKLTGLSLPQSAFLNEAFNFRWLNDDASMSSCFSQHYECGEHLNFPWEISV